jgi:hypothetical protein
MIVDGTIIGYDPGGNWGHGLAKLYIRKSSIIKAHTETLDNTERVIQAIEKESSLLALGVDTLTCWGTGESGWRPADRWLKKNIKKSRTALSRQMGYMGQWV